MQPAQLVHEPRLVGVLCVVLDGGEADLKGPVEVAGGSGVAVLGKEGGTVC